MSGRSTTKEGFAQSLEKKLVQLGHTAAEGIGRILGEGKSGCWVKEDTYQEKAQNVPEGNLTAILSRSIMGEEQNLCEGLRPNAASCGQNWMALGMPGYGCRQALWEKSFPTRRLGSEWLPQTHARPWGVWVPRSEGSIYCGCLTVLGHIHVIFWLPHLNVMGPICKDLSSKLMTSLCGICLTKDAIVCFRWSLVVVSSKNAWILWG